MLAKNQTVTLSIEDMSVNGEGFGKINGYPLFVKDAVTGDVVEAVVTKTGKSYGFAHCARILTPSPDRVPVRCPHARVCGGCTLQALSYEKQLAFKEQKVREDLRRIGGFSQEELKQAARPILGTDNPWRYRNKAQYPVRADKSGKAATGFFAARSHRLVPVADCLLAAYENVPILRAVLSHVQKHRISVYNETAGRGFLRHIVTRKAAQTGEWAVTLVGNAKDASPLKAREELINRLQKIPGMTSVCFSPNQTNGNVILGNSAQVLWGREKIEDVLCGLRFELSPLSFFQVNPLQAERLYQTALSMANLSGNETVLDLYCGIGTLSLLFAKRARQVIGVEAVAAAVQDARRNAARNHLPNASFFTGRAEDAQLLPADVVVVDPPRKGCDKRLLQTILSLAPGRVVYVSCNCATLARDLKILCAGGYRLRCYQPVDMFPQTVHVECVVLLSRA